MITRRQILASSILPALPPLVTAKSAPAWAPSKPIRIVVPIVGSTNDAIARLVAPELQRALGQPVVVENKGGAGGTIGTSDVAKSLPDGHTLLVGFNGPLAINPTLFPKLSYDPLKDLTPLTLAVTVPQFLAVNAAVPAGNLNEFISLARTKPLNYASVSTGSASHLTMEMLKSAAKLPLLNHVPYRGAGPAVADLIGGQVDASFLVPGNITQFAKEGKVRLLACSGEQRFKSMPGVPTLVESGFKDLVALSWVGFLAPGGLPQPITDRLHAEITRILKSDEVSAKLKQMDFDVVAGTPKQFGDWIRAEIPRWGTVIRQVGVTVE